MRNNFQKWAFQNFPFMEETFKEIDNYHLMMDILHYLREQLKDYRELVVKVDELENWFNNLDVQDEIDKKLDEMAEDGTLAELIEDYATIPQLTSRVESLEDYNTTKESEELTEMVVIGDSYSSRTYLALPNKLWCEIVADDLKLNLHNYGDPGAGYLADGDERSSTFITQLNEAHNDTSFNDSKVKYVFVYGGLNDLRYTDQTNKTVFINAYDSVFNNARTYFPNAKIVVLGCNTLSTFGSKLMSDNEKISELWIDKTIKHLDSFYSNNIICVDLTLFFIGQDYMFVGGINSHPNGNAHIQLASAVINGLNSSSNAFVHKAYATPVLDSTASGAWTLSNTLTSENIFQVRMTDKGMKLYLATCATRSGTSIQCIFRNPFGLIIPYSTMDDNYYQPKNVLANALMFDDTHTSAGVTDQGAVNIENNFGNNIFRMYVSLKNNAHVNIYDLYYEYDIYL